MAKTTTTKKKPAAKAKPKRKTVSKSATPKQPSKPKPQKTKHGDDKFFRINHVNGGPDYIYAENSADADEIENRLKMLQKQRKIRGYYRGLTPKSEAPGVVYEPRTPDQVAQI